MPEDFDLPVAIALAAAAFEAYLEPVGANEEFKEVTVNNTHTTYTDRCVLWVAQGQLIALCAAPALPAARASHTRCKPMKLRPLHGGSCTVQGFPAAQL